MRYTTIIDVGEMPAVYRNHNARLLYLHMVLRSGWHDADRDLLDASIRSLAMGAGLTVSATRHALGILERAGLVKRTGTVWQVRKWILEETPTPRPRTRKQQQQAEQTAQQRQDNERRERENEVEAIRRQQQWDAGKTSYMVWYEQQQAKAAAGDQEAARSVERNRTTYEQHRARIEAAKAAEKSKKSEIK